MPGHHYTESDLDSWSKWFETLDGTGPYHDPEYLSLLAGNYEDENETAELFVYREEDSFVYYPYIRRELPNSPFVGKALDEPEAYSDIISSWYWGGPLHSSDAGEELAVEFLEAFRTHCMSKDIISEFIRFDPNNENHKSFPELEPDFDRKTVTVDLTQTKEEIWDGYEGRNQRAIRQAEKSSIEIIRSESIEDVLDFHEIYTNAMDARDASEHYRFSKQFFKQLFSSRLFTFIIAQFDSKVVGGFIIAHDDEVGHHYLSASNPEYWDDRVNNLMYHQAVMEMKDGGHSLFDFQGGRPGVFNFKKGFSKEGRGEFFTANKIHMPEEYDKLSAAADDYGIDTSTGYFPDYRVEKTN